MHSNIRFIIVELSDTDSFLSSVGRSEFISYIFSEAHTGIAFESTVPSWDSAGFSDFARSIYNCEGLSCHFHLGESLGNGSLPDHGSLSLSYMYMTQH